MGLGAASRRGCGGGWGGNSSRRGCGGGVGGGKSAPVGAARGGRGWGGGGGVMEIGSHRIPLQSRGEAGYGGGGVSSRRPGVLPGPPCWAAGCG